MDRRGNRPGALARGAVTAALSLCVVACGAEPAPRAQETTAASPEPAGDAAAIAAAEATVRAFFAVKGRAEDPIRVQIDKQAVFLTTRDVHPTTAFDASTSDQPSGITDETVQVDLSNARSVGEEVLVDFAFQSTGVTYTMVSGEMQLDTGQPQESHWDGTATLEERDGEWLINDLSVESHGSSIS